MIHPNFDIALVDEEAITLYQAAVKKELPMELRLLAATEFRSRYYSRVWGREGEREKILQRMEAQIDKHFPPAT